MKRREQKGREGRLLGSVEGEIKKEGHVERAGQVGRRQGGEGGMGGGERVERVERKWRRVKEKEEEKEKEKMGSSSGSVAADCFACSGALWSYGALRVLGGGA